MKVLFIGNSFTYFNDMPYTFSNMLRQTDPDSRVDTIAYGGYSLMQYADETTEVGRSAIGKILSYDWDCVVLQEQSLLPCTDPALFSDAVKKLCGLASQSGARAVLFQTWAYERGSEKLASTGMTYEEMNRRLEEAYAAAASENGALLAPVGRLFAKIADSDSITRLINRNDNYHPSASGSYLAACVIYRVITGKTAIGLPSPANVSLYNLSVIQRITDELPEDPV